MYSAEQPLAGSGASAGAGNSNRGCLIKEASLEDIRGFLPNMREESRKELGAVEAERLQGLSEITYIGRYDEKDVCLWGLIRPVLVVDQVSLWMLGANGIEDCPKVFLRYTKRYMRLLKEYGRVTTAVRADFTVSRRWVEWLGFKELVYTTTPSSCIYEGQVVVYELEK